MNRSEKIRVKTNKKIKYYEKRNSQSLQNLNLPQKNKLQKQTNDLKKIIKANGRPSFLKNNFSD